MAEPIGLYLSANPTGVPEPNQLAASIFLLAGAGIGALIKRRYSKKGGLRIIHKRPRKRPARAPDKKIGKPLKNSLCDFPPVG
jgi:hypothetical protein